MTATRKASGESGRSTRILREGGEADSNKEDKRRDWLEYIGSRGKVGRLTATRKTSGGTGWIT